MKIIVTANGTNLDAAASPIFGRCPTYIVVDPETMQFEAIENPALAASGGAGVQAAQFIAGKGAQAVVTDNVGPNAFDVLKAAGVPVYTFSGGTVREAVGAYTAGQLSAADGATTPRIAISANENNGLDSAIGSHFGRCPYFVLADVEGQDVVAVQTVANPYYGHHQPGQVPGFVRSQGADVMLTGGMGGRAIGFFEQYGIQPVTGASGTVRWSLEQYLAGALEGGAPCRESIEHGHGEHEEGR
jgi:predicted Fe-Mo cluster-binding NifX family protein